jgi:hypothetical protein
VGLERGLAVGVLVALAGVGLLLAAVHSWSTVGFGQLDPRVSMRQAIPAVVLFILGLQTILSSFLFSLLGLSKRRSDP